MAAADSDSAGFKVRTSSSALLADDLSLTKGLRFCNVWQASEGGGDYGARMLAEDAASEVAANLKLTDPRACRGGNGRCNVGGRR